MAFLKETVGSLRAYLVLCGISAVFGNLGATVLSLVGVLLGASILWVAISFRSLLAKHPNYIVNVLVANLVWVILLGLLGVLAGEVLSSIAIVIVSTAVALYLVKSVRRLASEAHSTPV
jgi:hypothetical protein